MERLTRRALELPRATLILVFGLSLLAAAGVPRIGTEVGYRGVLGDAHPSVLELEDFIGRFGGGLPVFAVYSCEETSACESVFDEAPLRMARRIEQAMLEHPLVRRVDSPASGPILVPAPGGFAVRRLVEDGSIAADRDELRERALGDALWEGQLVSRDGRVGSIVVQLASSDSRTTSSVVPALREAIAPFEADGFRFHLVGDPVDFAVAGGELQRETPRIVPLMIALVAGIILALLRSWRMMVVALLTTGLAVLWAIGAMGWLGWPQSELTQALAPAVLVIGVCSAIHVLARYASLADSEPDSPRREIVLRVVREIGTASMVCAFTTVAGFLSFSTSEFASFLRFGAVASIGVLAALLLSFTLLPVLLVRIPIDGAGVGGYSAAWDRALQLVVRISERRGAAILTIAGVLLLVCGLGVIRLEVDVDERELLGSKSEVVRWAEFVEENLRRSDTLEIEIAAPEGESVLEPAAMAVVEGLASRLPKIDGLGRVRSIVDPLQRLNRILHDDDPAEQRTGSTRAANRQLLLVMRLDEATQPDLWIDAEERRVRFSIEADPVAKSRRIAIVGEVEAALATALPSGWSFRLTGPFALYLDLIREMQDTQIRAFAGSAIAVGLIFCLFLWGTGSTPRMAAWWAFVGMIPNLLPVVVTLGAMGLWGIPLDVGTIMVGAIVLGIAVDDTIHFVTHYRSERDKGVAPRDAISITMRRAGRAIVTTSCALALGFFALTLSSWQSIASFGLLSGIAILAALAADLFVLPALILVLSPAQPGPERQQVSRALPRRGRGLLAVLAVLATGGLLQQAASGMAASSELRPTCRWLGSGHVLPPGSLDDSCPLDPFERVELLVAGGMSVRPQERAKLRQALATGPALRARVTRGEESHWIDVPLLDGRGPRTLPRLAAAGIAALLLVGLGVFLIAYSSAPAALPFLVLCSALATLAIDALCGTLAQLPPWPALVALGIAPAAAAHLALSFPRPGGLLAAAPGVVPALYGTAAPVLGILLWGAHEYPALVRAASAACASLLALVWALLVLKCRVQRRESPVALERARARAAHSGMVAVGLGLALLGLASEVGGVGSMIDLLTAGMVALPLPIGYALARYQLNDVRPHVRQVASYALLHVAWALALATLLAEILHRGSLELTSDPVAALASLTLLLLIAVGARDSLLRLVRRGIPTVGARLRELERQHARTLEPLREPDQTAALSAEAIHVGLAGHWVSLFLRADSGWRLAASYGSRPAATSVLAESAARACRDVGAAVHLAYEGGAEGPDADLLREAKVELVAPVRCQGELLGIALVGASDDGLPYTRTEIAFADSIAARAGVAVHRARLAEELLRAERFEAVGRISAGLAHDLGKPLSLVYQRARAMGRSVGSPDEVRRHAESIAALADDALATLDHLVEQGRAVPGPGSFAPLADLVARSVQAAERMHGPDRVAVRLTPSLPDVSAPRDLQAVLANLLDNALRAGSRDPVDVYAIADGEDVVIEIIDHGVGMDERTLRRAFQPFFTTRSRQGGRGIGLAASQALMEQLGGTLDLESRPGCGTRARVRVPAARREDDRGH